MADTTKFIYTNSGTPYLDAYEAYRTGLEQQRAQQRAQIEARRDADIAEQNKTYDNSARQNYITYMQAMKNAPNQLNSLGIRGGASESSMIRLGTNYNSNVANNEAARGSAIGSLRTTYGTQLEDLDNDYNQRITDALATAQQNQLKWEQEQLDTDLQRFSASITGQYKTKKGYEKLIKKLKESNDPNKKYKIALARQAMNALKDEGAKGGGGSKSSSRRSYGGGGYSSTSTSTSKNSGKGGTNSAAKANAKAINDKYKNRAAQAKKKATKSGWKKYGVTKSTGRWVG